MEGSPAKLHHAAAYADREDDHAPGNGISKALLQPTRLDDKRQLTALPTRKRPFRYPPGRTRPHQADALTCVP
ncbi:hypothetical protein NOVOSPHI9U_90003 [Novosphingobium sp. 9U]|nr:hypothetical protein NOVOSPHI9U_90003 [Novosphingobium sp. 9U]